MKDIDEIIKRTVVDNNGCWIWTGAVNKKTGYALANVNNKTTSVHRLVFELSSGCKPRRLVCHKCDNRRCVNPEHLYDGSYSDNRKDFVERYPHRHAVLCEQARSRGIERFADGFRIGNHWSSDHVRRAVAVANMTSKRRERSKVSIDDAFFIRRTFGALSQRQIAEIYNVSSAAVSLIVRNKTHLDCAQPVSGGA